MKTPHVLRSSRAVVLAAGLLWALAPVTSRAASLVYWVDVNMSSVIGNANAPYSLDLDFTKGTGNIANTVTVSNVTYMNSSGATLSPTGTLTYSMGSAVGTLGSSLVLSSGSSDPSATNNEYAEVIPTGTAQVWFKVTETNNAEVVGSGTPIPDQFSVYLDDKSSYPIGTTATDGFTLVGNSLTANPFINQVSTFTTNGTQAGVTASISATPEPGRAALLFFGVLGMMARRSRKRSAQTA